MRWYETRWILYDNNAPKSHGFDRAANPGRKTNYTHSAASILIITHTMWLWLFPRQKMGLLSQCFDTWRQQIQCNSWPEHHTKGGFPWVLPSMAKLLEQVWVRTRDVLKGWLDWKALHFRYLSFTAEFQELFDPRTNICNWQFRHVRCICWYVQTVDQSIHKRPQSIPMLSLLNLVHALPSNF